MGKQSRRKGDQAKGAEAAGRYLRRLGLPLRADADPFRRMGEADPGWAARLAELDDRSIALAGDAAADPDEFHAVARKKYALIYRDLDTALADYAARAVAIAAAWLPWWFEHHPPATRLLDAGCGAGVLTCAYALALPDTEVVGFDYAPEAVACAEGLARRVGATNVSFVVADFTTALEDEFDQVLAVTALADAGLYPQRRPAQDPFSSLAEIDGPALDFTAGGISALAGRVAADGWFLAYDRTPEAPQAVWFGASLVNAGLDLDLEQAGADDLTEDGERRTFTRFVGRRSTAPVTTAADLGRWVKSVDPPAYGKAWHEELRFERLRATGATLVGGAEIDYAPHSELVERREAWAHGSGAYGWVTTTSGLRELTRAPTREALVAALDAYARKWAAAGLKVRRYGPTR